MKTCYGCNYDLEIWRYIGKDPEYPCSSCSRNNSFTDNWVGKKPKVNELVKPPNSELKRVFDSQCSPCISGYPECGGDEEKAGNWVCPKFHSGFMTLTIG